MAIDALRDNASMQSMQEKMQNLKKQLATATAAKDAETKSLQKAVAAL